MKKITIKDLLKRIEELEKTEALSNILVEIGENLNNQ